MEIPFQGHMYLIPRYSSHQTFILPLIPIGEWKFEFVMKGKVSDTEEFVGSYSIFYEI